MNRTGRTKYEILDDMHLADILHGERNWERGAREQDQYRAYCVLCAILTGIILVAWAGIK